MDTKYIILVKQDMDSIIEGIFGSTVYVSKYRSNYDYLETTFKKLEAKTYKSFKAADTAGRKITEIYGHISGYEVLPVKKRK